jgi:hypothetical protein
VPVNNNASTVEGEPCHEHGPRASIPEIMATDALNSLCLSDGYLRDQERENDNFRIISDQQHETAPLQTRTRKELLQA